MLYNSNCVCVLVISGTDPAADLYKFAEEMKFLKKLTAISLGQGQVQLYTNAYTGSYTYAHTQSLLCIYTYIYCRVQ